MARVKLTAGRVREFEVREGQQQSFLWDNDAPWLAVRATRGAKVFVFQSRLGGKTLRVKIGDVRAWDIDVARTEARRLQTLIDRGMDPRDERADRIAAAQVERSESRRRNVTVSDAWSSYLEARRPRWRDRYYRHLVHLARLGGDRKRRGPGRITAGPLAALMPIKLTELTPEGVRDWLRTEAQARPTAARHGFAALKAMVGWCETRPDYRGLADPSAFAGRIASDELPKRKTRTDVLQRQQLPAWFAEVQRLKSAVFTAYLQVLLLTGARRDEISSLEWENVDFTWGTLTISDKIDRWRTIPLTPYVASLLNTLPRRGRWVFYSPASASGHIENPTRPHNLAVRNAGLPHLTIHGLRRSFKTLAEWVEVPKGIVDQIQGHRPSTIPEKHYIVRPIDLLRLWHVKLEAWILTEAVIEQPKASQASDFMRRVK